MPSVKDVTVLTPRFIRVEGNDGDIAKGIIETLGVADAGSYNTWLSRNSDYAAVVGPGKLHLKYQDDRPTTYLDRDAAVVAGNYGTIGGRTVTNVYIKINQYDYGEVRGTAGAFTTKAVSMRWKLYLELDGDLAEGDHTIDFPAATGLPDEPFTYDSYTTRCCAIGANQHGHRPGDSKIAYIRQWIPDYGTNGEFDLVTDQSLTEFQVIDEDGNEVYKGNIVSRIGPTDAEDGWPISDTPTGTADRQRYWVSDDPFATITGISVDGGTGDITVTYSGTDPANGDVIGISGVKGMTEINDLFTFQKVSAVNTGAKTFVLQDGSGVNVDGSGFSAYTSGGNIYATFLSNTAATYVYGMDYSAFQPSVGGVFRLRLPGIGVSDPIRIDNAVYLEDAKVRAMGLYHQRSGIPIDGRFGYSRPTAHKTGEDTTILKSTLPYAWTNEYSDDAFDVQQNAGAGSPYITATADNDYWGGVMDAGDWDTRLPNITDTTYTMMAVHDALSSGSRATLDFNLPKSSELLSSSLYTQVDGEDDLLHELIWRVDTYRRNQQASGGVGAGINIGTTDINFGEPSYLFRGTVYSYSPDHVTSWCFAGLAAKLASILTGLGYTSLAATYQTAAVAAWDWAEAIYNDTGTARDDAYGAFKTDVQSDLGWSNAEWDAKLATLLSGGNLGYRNFAAACLFSLTGTASYGSVVQTAWSFDLFGIAGCAAFEYLNATGADAATVTAMEAAMLLRADNNIVSFANSDVSYRTMGYANITLQFGEKSGAWGERLQNLIFAHRIDGDAKYLNVIADSFTYINGANQTELCWTTGLGARNTKGVLHKDSQYSGQDVPKGLCIYGPNRYGSGIKGLNFKQNYSQLNYLQNDIAVGETAEFGENAIPSPHWLAWPILEGIWENPEAIEQLEYTAQQSVEPQFSGAVYLHGHDGNTQSQYDTYPGAPNMLVEIVNGNEIRTNGSLIKATNLHFGASIAVFGETVTLTDVDRAVNLP